MHPNRRRKKRPNYGIRTVEVNRGPNGFGFTISGQQPCILSCIVSKSPADLAGLRAGDFLISVNGTSVSKSTHDSVVNLIGSSIGPIQMTIAENYYSDSSDEDLDLSRIVNNRKPKHTQRPRMHRNYKHEGCVNSSADRLPFNSPIKKVMRLQNPVGSPRKQPNADANQDGSSKLSPSAQQGGPIEYKALVGYLGTIEMPKQLAPSARLHTVCSCIRKLRQEKRLPTSVLMTVLPTCLTLKNSSNQILAIYPTSRVVYISSTNDRESRYFGLVTSAICDRSTENIPNRTYPYSNIEKSNSNIEEKLEIEISNSCHVFVTDYKLIEHSVHAEKADHFKISCTQDVVTGNCVEFPKNALYIVSLVQNMYKLQNSTSESLSRHSNHRNQHNQEDNFNPVMANSPQPSASSNSDSGIGFRDDCLNISDRILVVEFPSQQQILHVSSSANRPSGIVASSVLLENLDMSIDNSINNESSFESYSDVNNIRSKGYETKLRKDLNNQQLFECCDDIKDNKSFNNINNIRACERIRKNKSFGSKESINREHGNVDNQIEMMDRLTVRAMLDYHPISIEEMQKSSNKNLNTERYSERAVDVPDYSPSKKSCESVSIYSGAEDDFKSSVDNISVHSSKSLESKNIKNIFKTPSMSKYFENKKSLKRVLKAIGSYDNLIAEKNHDALFHYKLSPKVYGLSKPTQSCEELNTIDITEKCNYGSLQDLCSLVDHGNTKRNIAQSEPDVRIPRLHQDYKFLCDENGVKSSKQAEAAAVWTVSFEKLLEDSMGLQVFAEFLKKEFSAENIYFWTACERFRRISSNSERTYEAQKIYQKHLCVGAVEAVNVDSQARHCTEQALQEADISLFDQAEKQIFNLMKFDSYPRFLKSELYKQCLSGNFQVPFDSNLSLYPPGLTTKLKKSLSNAEDRRRKSLLPWHRKTNRSKSKDRGEVDYTQKGDESCLENGKSDVNDLYSSKSSLASQESTKYLQDDFVTGSRGPLCRVILGNGSTTVVQLKDSETIEELINRVLDKRGLSYSTFQVFTDKHSKSLNINECSSVLAGCEVRIEPRVVFKLDLPNRKIIAVTSKNTKVIVDVLRPILSKYNYNLEDVRVISNKMEYIDIAEPVTTIDKMRLQVLLINDIKDQEVFEHQKTANVDVKSFNSTFLDEITNNVFKDLLHEKTDLKCKSGSDRGSLKSEDWGSEHSSGILGKFLRRDSGIHEKKKKCIPGRLKDNSNHSSIEDIAADQSNNSIKKPLIAKWKSGVNKLHISSSESEKLYEGLNKAQSSRIEDQRGTEINFELPDFLKDKENNENKCPRLRKAKLNSDCNSNLDLSASTSGKMCTQTNNYENNTIISKDNGPSNSSFNHIGRALLSVNLTNKAALDESLLITHSRNGTSTRVTDSTMDNNTENCKSGEPPPLPPKPKVLPIKPSNWGQNGLFKVPRIPRNEIKQNLYLEQPTSSFV